MCIISINWKHWILLFNFNNDSADYILLWARLESWFSPDCRHFEYVPLYRHVKLWQIDANFDNVRSLFLVHVTKVYLKALHWHLSEVFFEIVTWHWHRSLLSCTIQLICNLRRFEGNYVFCFNEFNFVERRLGVFLENIWFIFTSLRINKFYWFKYDSIDFLEINCYFRNF